MEGYQFLGIFSSDGASGVIVETQQKEKMRLGIGGSTGGWTLEKIDLRSAQFVDASGKTASLDLAVASSLPLPTPILTSGVAKSVRDEIAPVDDAEQTNGPADHDPLTFESIARRNEQQMRTKLQQDSPKPKGTD